MPWKQDSFFGPKIPNSIPLFMHSGRCGETGEENSCSLLGLVTNAHSSLPERHSDYLYLTLNPLFETIRSRVAGDRLISREADPKLRRLVIKTHETMDPVRSDLQNPQDI